MDTSWIRQKVAIFWLIVPFCSVSANEAVTLEPPINNETVEININAPTRIGVPPPKRCRIDLKNKSKVKVRVSGSKKVFHYPLRRSTGSDPQIMALNKGVARELLDAPVTKAYAVPKYGIGYGYEGTGLLVFSGLIIEECPLPIPVTGLFMPVKFVSPYVNRDFLARYFGVNREE